MSNKTKTHKPVTCDGEVCIPVLMSLHVVLQVYTKSVIEPLPPVEGDAAAKAADRQRRKGKMTDEEIMDKLSE